MSAHAKLLLSLVASFALAGILGIEYRREIRWQYKLMRDSRSNSVPASAPPEPHCPRCNLILISLDTLRADRMGFLGAQSGLTPNLDKIATKSFVFKNAFTNAFFTTPSHMTVFTSLYPTTHRVEGTDVKVPRLPKTEGPAIALDERFKTLAELLREKNFATAWSGPLNFRFLDFRDGFGRGFQRTGPPVFMRGLHFPLKRLLGLDKPVLEKTLKNLDSPFFLFLHSYVTHLPYVPPSGGPSETEVPYKPAYLLEGLPDIAQRNPESLFPGFNQKNFDPQDAINACTNYDSMNECFRDYISPDQLIHRLGQWQLRLARKAIRERSAKELNQTELNAYISAYDEGVRESDRQIGQLWTELSNKGLLKNSIVLIFSDHGEELFDHGEGNHSTFLEHTARVPLLIYIPDAVPAPSEQMVSLVDVLPTLLGILNLPKPEQAQGESLFNAHVGRKRVFGATLGVAYVRDTEWKYIVQEQKRPELFNIRLDPQEKENLMGLRLPAVRAKLRELENALSDFRSAQAL